MWWHDHAASVQDLAAPFSNILGDGTRCYVCGLKLLADALGSLCQTMSNAGAVFDSRLATVLNVKRVVYPGIRAIPCWRAGREYPLSHTGQDQDKRTRPVALSSADAFGVRS